MDLSVFQFDSDLSFAVFFLNADGTVYGRYGTRSDLRQAEREVSLTGLAKAMRAALALHGDYPANKAKLAGKTGPKPPHKVLTDYPWVRSWSRTRDKKLCMTCHVVCAAERMTLRTAGKPLPPKQILVWPMPNVVGLTLDPNHKARVAGVAADSPAGKAGFRVGDEIVTLEGQAILSIADVQWALHHAAKTAALKAEVRRGDGKANLTLRLPDGWRDKTDISWRPSTGMLRFMVLGGMRTSDMTASQRKIAGLDNRQMALRVLPPVQPVTRAFKAGFRPGDIIVSFGAHRSRMSEVQLLVQVLQTAAPKGPVPVTVLRRGQRVALKLPSE
jgi:hypothetical protein